MIQYIVEGLDATGKSTFIKKLIKELSVQNQFSDHRPIYHHFEFPLGDTNEEKYGYQHGQFQLMFDFIRASHDRIQYVFDRAHIGEYIWSPIYRERTPEYLRKLEEDNSDLPIVILHVHADPEVIKARFDKREDEKTPSLEYIKEYSEKFRIECEKSPFPVINFDTTRLKPEDLDEEIKLLLQNGQEYEPK